MSHALFALSRCLVLPFLAAGFFFSSHAATVPSQTGAWKCGAVDWGWTYTTDPRACFSAMMSSNFAQQRVGYGEFWGENTYISSDSPDLSTTNSKKIKHYYSRCYYDNNSYQPKCPESGPEIYINAHFVWDGLAESCPDTHPFPKDDPTQGTLCSDVPRSCEDMDTMSESCCQDLSEFQCHSQGKQLSGWEIVDYMGYQRCTTSCLDPDPEPEPEPDPTTEDECRQEAAASCAATGGLYNYHWDSEFGSCAFSCNDAPEDPIDPDAPDAPDPENEPSCSFINTSEGGYYVGQCVDDPNPDNGNCVAQTDENGNETGRFTGQCIAGDGVSAETLAKIGNKYLLGIDGGVKAINERLKGLPEAIACAFGFCEDSNPEEDFKKAFDGEFSKDPKPSEVSWLRGLFGLGDETGMELIPSNEIDVADEAGNYRGAISGGGCPAPETMALSHGTYQIPYDTACEVFSKLRPIMVAIAWFIASLIVFAPSRSN